MGNRTTSRREVLRKCGLFHDLNDGQLDLIVDLCRMEAYEAGKTIFTEGDRPDDFYIVMKGKVGLDANLGTRPGSRKSGTVDVAMENDVLGWSAIAGMEGHTLTGHAIDDTELVAIEGAAFRATLERDPTMAWKVARHVMALCWSRLQRTKQTLGRVLSVASHDLRAPINAAQSYLSVITEGYIGEVEHRQRDMLIRSSARLSQVLAMIDNILDVTRFESGRLTKEDLSLSSLVRDSAELHRGVAERRGLSLAVEVPDDPVRVVGSAESLRQVISNLVGNAIKFTPRGGEVKLSIRVEGGQARVEVADTGVGISSLDLPRIFDDFYQGQAAQSADVEAKGVGLGLSISRKIVEAHKGRIWAKSPRPDIGYGSLFVFVLPIGTPSVTGDQRVQVPTMEVTVEAGKKVLIVDDDPDMVAAMRAVLEHHGFQVPTAQDGYEGLKKLAQEKPDLIILDLLMPRMNGFAMMKESRLGDKYPNVPVLVLTSTREELGRRRYELETGLTLDVDDYVEKPVDPHSLVEKVKRILGKSAAVPTV